MLLHDGRNAQIIIPTMDRTVGLIVTDIVFFGLTYVCPLRKSLPPPSVVLGKRVKLR
ncbi:hypothetical protein D3C80_2157970 [compost metagenome]